MQYSTLQSCSLTYPSHYDPRQCQYLHTPRLSILPSKNGQVCIANTLGLTRWPRGGACFSAGRLCPTCVGSLLRCGRHGTGRTPWCDLQVQPTGEGPGEGRWGDPHVETLQAPAGYTSSGYLPDVGAPPPALTGYSGGTWTYGTGVEISTGRGFFSMSRLSFSSLLQIVLDKAISKDHKSFFSIFHNPIKGEKSE